MYCNDKYYGHHVSYYHVGYNPKSYASLIFNFLSNDLGLNIRAYPRYELGDQLGDQFEDYGIYGHFSNREYVRLLNDLHNEMHKKYGIQFYGLLFDDEMKEIVSGVFRGVSNKQP